MKAARTRPLDWLLCRGGSALRVSRLLVLSLVTAILLANPSISIADEEWGLSLHDDDEHSDADAQDAEAGDALDEGVFAPDIPPEYIGEVVEPAPGAPSTLVVIGGARSTENEHATDLERLMNARLVRMPELAKEDTEAVLLAGAGGDPEVSLLEARGYAGRGMEQYHTLALEEAVSSFEKALDSYAKAMPAGFDPREMAEAYLMLGATHFVAGDRQSAQEAFRQALVLDPEHEPDEGLR